MFRANLHATTGAIDSRQQQVGQELDHCPARAWLKVYRIYRTRCILVLVVNVTAVCHGYCCLWHLQAQVVVVFAARVLEVRHVYRARDDFGL